MRFHRRGLPRETHLTGRFIVAGAVSLVAWAALGIVSPPATVLWSQEMRAAAEIMEEAVAVVARRAVELGLQLDPTLDPNRTGLVGPEYTPLFTTLGQLEAKRTTTNPDMAALLAHLLRVAGVEPGDTVAVGASGSFPALLIATLAAARAMEVYPVTILSLGASSYGATRPELHLLAIHEHLEASHIVDTPPAAVSLGGRKDVGGEFDPSFRDRLREDIRGSGTLLIEEADLRANVDRRMEIYRGPPVSGGSSSEARGGCGPAGDSGRIAAFVSIGGSYASLGTSPRVLEVPPGLVGEVAESALPDPPERGVLFEMAAGGVPVIHLLHVRGLALRHGLPWDPVPFPPVGTTDLTVGEVGEGWAFWLVTAAYAVALGIVAWWDRLSRRRRPRQERPPVRQPLS
ncbi:poly-gamma-glutamate system protein [Gemmatimonadota bacterium]